jgi:DNA-binding NarL/FixJ family response regulator
MSNMRAGFKGGVSLGGYVCPPCPQELFVKYILFVAGDENVPAVLRSRLRRKRSVWDVRFVRSAGQALELAARVPLDVVVAGTPSAEPEGATLLAEIRARYPATVRIALSGHGDPGTVDPAHQLAHRVLGTPLEWAALERAIARSCALKDLLAGPAPAMVMRMVERLQPSPAEREYGLSAEAAPPAGGLADSSADPARGRFGRAGVLMARVLEAAGSATRDDAGLGVEDRLRHAWATASLAHATVFPGESSASAYLAGWLHDVGELVLLAGAPQAMRAAAMDARATGRQRSDVERERMGISHAEVGALVLDRWDLPHAVTEAVAHHHQPSRIAPDGLDAVAAVHAANALLADGVVPADDATGEQLLDREWLGRAGLIDRIPSWRVLALTQARRR